MNSSSLLLAGHPGCLTHLQSRNALPLCALLARSLSRSLRTQLCDTPLPRAAASPMASAAKVAAHV